jgi:D-alanyl-D-alanine carboxypeptidase
MSDPAVDSVSDRLEQEIGDLFASHRLIGASVGIVRDQELVWTRGFGFADIETGRTPDEHTIYRVASNTKTFTATAIFQLRDEGKLLIDDPVVKYIPEFASVKPVKASVESVTLRRLLCHHSGLMGEAPGDYWEAREFPTIAEFLDRLPEVELVIEPDSAFKYSNLAFALLGEVVARVSGRAYEEYVHTEILAPLGMSSSVFALTDELGPRMATGYQVRRYEDSPGIATHAPLNGHTAAGQLYSTVSDLAKWLSLQFRTDVAERGGAQVLAGSSLVEMHRPQFMEPDWQSGACLPWAAARFGDQVFLGHGGGVFGFLTQTRFCVQDKLGVIWLTNADGHAANLPITERIIHTLAQADAGVSQPRPPTKPVPTPEEWRDFLGTYVGELGGIMNIEFRDGALLVVAPPGERVVAPPVKLEPTEVPDTFMVTSGRGAGEPLLFKRDQEGNVASLSNAGFVSRKLVTA